MAYGQSGLVPSKYRKGSLPALGGLGVADPFNLPFLGAGGGASAAGVQDVPFRTPGLDAAITLVKAKLAQMGASGSPDLPSSVGYGMTLPSQQQLLDLQEQDVAGRDSDLTNEIEAKKNELIARQYKTHADLIKNSMLARKAPDLGTRRQLAVPGMSQVQQDPMGNIAALIMSAIDPKGAGQYLGATATGAGRAAEGQDAQNRYQYEQGQQAEDRIYEDQVRQRMLEDAVAQDKQRAELKMGEVLIDAQIQQAEADAKRQMGQQNKAMVLAKVKLGQQGKALQTQRDLRKETNDLRSKREAELNDLVIEREKIRAGVERTGMVGDRPFSLGGGSIRYQGGVPVAANPYPPQVVDFGGGFGTFNRNTGGFGPPAVQKTETPATTATNQRVANQQDRLILQNELGNIIKEMSDLGALGQSGSGSTDPNTKARIKALWDRKYAVEARLHQLAGGKAGVTPPVAPKLPAGVTNLRVGK